MGSDTTGEIYSGASGIVLPVPNKSLYPPEFQDKSRLTYYSSLFKTIEINSSFYKLPQGATVKKWAESVPENFKFTFKLWKEVTHNKGLIFDPGNVHAFFDRISNAGSNTGCVLVQFPPSVDSKFIMELNVLLQEIQSANCENEWKIAIEFRHSSWYDGDVYDLCDSYKATIVIQDLPASATPMPDVLPDHVYVRFHGPNGGYRGSYSDDFLNEYAYYIHEWKQEGKQVYVYFNNTMGNAVHNLVTLNRYLSDMES